MFVALACLASSILIMPHEEKSFVAWMRNNNVLYTGDEYYFRLGIFLTHARLVSEFKGNFRIALNKFACTTPAEHKAMLGLLYETGESGIKMTTKPNYKAPESIDWREKGAVTPIQEQGQCGGCWAFSATAGAEGAWFVKGNKLLKLSEQNLIDCTLGCMGCYGGFRDTAYDYVKSNQGGKMQLEDDYPYLGYNGQCHFDASKGVANIDGYITVTYEDEVELANTVAEHGPTTAGIDSTAPKFMLYSSGIYDDTECSQETINHGICIVGYGSENGVDYWLVKNSWGVAWGEEGYVRMARGKALCGISHRCYCPLA